MEEMGKVDKPLVRQSWADTRKLKHEMHKRLFENTVVETR